MKKILQNNASSATTQEAPTPQAAIVIGQRLKKARQDSSADLKDLATRLKVPESKLIAMEDGTLTMPHLIFLRGMLRSYAKVLGIDINAELAELGAAEEETAAPPKKPKNTIVAPLENPKKMETIPPEKAKKAPVVTPQKNKKKTVSALEQKVHAIPESDLPPRPNAAPRTHKLLLWLMLGIFFSGSAIYLIAEQVKSNDDVTPSTVIDTTEQSPATPLPDSGKLTEVYPQPNSPIILATPAQKPEAQPSTQAALSGNKTKGRNPAANPRVLSLSNKDQAPSGEVDTTDTTIVDDIVVKPIKNTTIISPSIDLPETATPITIDKAPINASANSAEEATPITIDKTPTPPQKNPANPSIPNELEKGGALLDKKSQSGADMALPMIDNMMLNRLTNSVPRFRSRSTQVASEKPLMRALKTSSTIQPLLSIKFNGKSWYAISDANGKVLASGAGQPGDVQKIRGTAPIKIALGNTHSVEDIEFRGKHVDLEKTESGVARLNLK